MRVRRRRQDCGAEPVLEFAQARLGGGIRGDVGVGAVGTAAQLLQLDLLLGLALRAVCVVFDMGGSIATRRSGRHISIIDRETSGGLVRG